MRVSGGCGLRHGRGGRFFVSHCRLLFGSDQQTSWMKRTLLPSVRRVGLLLLPGVLFAQTAVTRRSESAKENPVELSPFVVATDRDTGWVASSTLLGNRSNEQILNLPLSVDVLTADFMRDMGVFAIED